MRETKKKTTYNPIWTSVVLNVISLVISAFIYKPFFEENDDAFITMIAEGAYGARETHLIYTNIILGNIYKALYSLCPMVRWHSVLQYVFLFTALTTLTYIIMKIRHGDGSRAGLMLSVILLLSISYEAYVSLQYSKTAALVSTIGYLCLLYNFRPKQSISATNGPQASSNTDLNNENSEQDSRRETVILRVLSYIFIIYGILLRDSSYLLATLLLLPLGIYEFVKLCMADDRKPNKIKAFIGCFAAVLCLFLLFKYVNKTSYDRDTAWKNFMEYNDVRMTLLDYRYDLMDYSKYGSRLEEMGISENDALLYVTWQFGDDRVLSTEAMKKVLEGAPKRRLDVNFLKNLAQHIYEDVLVFNPLVIGTLLIIFAVFGSLINDRNRGRAAAIIIQLAVFAGIIVYYEYSGRWSHRIVFAAMLLVAVVFIYVIADIDGGSSYQGVWASDTEAKGSPALCAAGLLIIACITVLLGNRLSYNSYRRNAPDYRAFLVSTGASDDTLYIADTFTFQLAYRYDVFKPYAQGSLRNFAAVGSWYVNSPVTKEITGRFGYGNPYLALAGIADKPVPDTNVILVDNMYVDEKVQFLNEHYGEHKAAELGENFGFELYRIE